MNEVNDPIVWTAACYDQLDARDPTVLMKSAYCELRHGVSRSAVEAFMGRRRERTVYTETLAQVCQEGLRDLGYSQGGWEGLVCWIGKQDEWREGDASQREWFRRGFEECHAKFGVDAKLEWRGDVCISYLWPHAYTPDIADTVIQQVLMKYKMPALEGTKYNGEYIEKDLDVSQFKI